MDKPIITSIPNHIRSGIINLSVFLILLSITINKKIGEKIFFATLRTPTTKEQKGLVEI
jgi:hypothetical protein